MSKKPIPGSFTRNDTSSEYASEIPDLAMPPIAVPVKELVDTESVKKHIQKIQQDIERFETHLKKIKEDPTLKEFVDYYTEELGNLRGKLSKAEAILERASPPMTTESGLKPTSGPQSSKLFPGKRLGGKRTKRRRHRSRSRKTN